MNLNLELANYSWPLMSNSHVTQVFHYSAQTHFQNGFGEVFEMSPSHINTFHNILQREY